MGHLAGKPVLAFLVPSNPAIHPHSRSPPPTPSQRRKWGEYITPGTLPVPGLPNQVRRPCQGQAGSQAGSQGWL